MIGAREQEAARFLRGCQQLIPKSSAAELQPRIGMRQHVPREDRPLVLLVDAGCFSACEDLVGSLRGAPGVRVVGETTGGSTGHPVFLSLDEGFGVRVSARRVALPDSTPFEGRGIRPDVPIARGIDDYRTGADPMLEVAIAEAGQIAWRRSSAERSLRGGHRRLQPS